MQTYLNFKRPSFMCEDVFEAEFKIPTEKKDIFWHKLQQRETFVEGQVPPYKVEFESERTAGAFQVGEKNIHHGPLLNLPGEIGDISETYRALHYYYGSYIVSFKIVRPVLLEFFKTQKGIKIVLRSYVHPFFLRLWRLGNTFFWKQFSLIFLLRK